MSRPWLSPVKGTSQWYRDADLPYSFDLAAARRLLGEAGLRTGFATDFYVERQPFCVRIAEVVAAAWRKVGVEVTLRDLGDAPPGWLPPVSLRTECGHNLTEPVYDIAHDYLAMNPVLPLPGGPTHIGNWHPRWIKNPVIQRQFADFLLEPERRRKRQMFDELQRDIVRFGSTIFLAEMQHAVVANQGVPHQMLQPDSRVLQALLLQNPRADNYLPPRTPI